MLICDHHRVQDNMGVCIHTDSDLKLPDVAGTFYQEICFRLVRTISRKAHAKMNLLSCKQSWGNDGGK